MSRPYDVAFDGAARLDAAGLQSPAADARLLLAYAMELDVQQMLFADEVTPAQFERFESLLRRREQGIPVQHLTGTAYFRYEELSVGPGVFIPRPETELLVDEALRYLSGRPLGRRRVVELCAGSGAITRSLAKEAAGVELFAVELSPDAWPYLQRNLEGINADIRLGDMADAFRDLNGSVDLVITNPPYVPETSRHLLPADVTEHDPALALFSGSDGLDALRVVAGVANRLLCPGGLVIAEHDDSQSGSVVALFGNAGFERVQDHPDLNRRPRYVTALRADVAGLARD